MSYLLLFFSFLIISSVSKCVALDVVIMNGIPLICKMLTGRVTFPCYSTIPLCDSLLVLIVTISGIFLVIFRLSDLFGPNMSSACIILALVMGQFRINFSARN